VYVCGDEADVYSYPEDSYLTRDKRRKRKCVLASQPEDLSPPVTDSDSVVEP